MEMLTLRQARITDIAEIMRLECAGFASHIQETESTFVERLAAGAEGCWVLADEAQRLYGYLCAEFWTYAEHVSPAQFARDHSACDTHRIDGEEIYISSMVVDPATRGTGWGGRLFNGALDAMLAQHPRLRSVILIVHPEWQGARQIYRRAGFAEIGAVPAYFSDVEGARCDAIIMRRAQATQATQATQII